MLARVFAPQVIISTAADRPTDVLAIDLDGDGDQDVVSGSADDNKVTWYENDGSQGFTSHTVTADANTVRGIFAVDLDGDGDVDLLSASYNDDKIAWYENDGEESFSPHVISTSAASAVTVFAVDLDEDGDMDVLSASYDDDKVAWYENNGSQQFNEHVISDSQAGTLSLYPVDLDGDGDLDLVATAAGESQVNWFQNDGAENFTERLVASDENGASSVVAADLDGDDDVDILASLYDQSLVVWYENDGQQAFSRHTVSDAAWGSYSVVATDLDGDGDLDVASASHNDDKVAWYENDGSGGFTTVDITTSADGAFAVHAALPADESLRPIRAPFYDTNRDGDISAEDFEVLKDHINLTQSPAGRIRVLPTDDGGGLLRQVQVGENFWLSVLVMDVRLDARGIFASYVKIHYDKDVVQVTGDPLFVSPYETSPHFDRSSTGLVDEVGAAASLDELGADEYVQFRLPMKATAEGLGSFSLSLAQESPDHDFLVFGWDYPVAARQVNLGTSTLLVQPSSGGEGEAAPELYACAAPAPLPLPAAAARPSLFDWVSDRSGSLVGYRQAVDDAMRTVVQQPAPLLERSTVQRIDGLEHGEEEADMLDEILVDEVFSGTGLPGA